ncbi:5176_t:CDS:2 [Diversispora eburnea]|uniref:5176_t:CDS:1 n=1 Tax=Diversispora eburnea TaxID=1213867 RepID=A0A9N9A310_9GLOM|nr:5176_t:CDS:2 [Diversispora eburnea]
MDEKSTTVTVSMDETTISTTVSMDDGKLDPSYEKVIESQVHIDNVKASYWKLYTYATVRDRLLMFIGLIFSGATGATLITSLRRLTIILWSSYTSVSLIFSQLIFIWVVGITRKIREKYLRAILRQNIAYFDKIGAGEVTTRITSDIHLIQDGISEKFAMAFQYFCQFVISFVIAFTKNWKMTFEICCLIQLVGITSGIVNKLTAVFMRRSSDFYSYSGIIAEEAINAKIEGRKKAITSGAGVGFTFFFIYSVFALAFWYGTNLILDGEITPGEIVNIYFAVIIRAFALGNITPDIQAFSFASGASSKIFETIQRVPPIDIESEGEKINIKGCILIKNVSFIYPARPTVQILNNVTLDIEPGSTVALVGSSSSGKSIIISLILRFYDPVSGEVQLDVHDIKSLNLNG